MTWKHRTIGGLLANSYREFSWRKQHREKEIQETEKNQGLMISFESQMMVRSLLKPALPLLFPIIWVNIQLSCKPAWCVFLSSTTERVLTNVVVCQRTGLTCFFMSDLLYFTTYRSEIYIPLALDSPGMLTKWRFLDCTPTS